MYRCGSSSADTEETSRRATQERPGRPTASTEIECRLLPQPIDRYKSAAQKIVDGAIFVYANSTNPELAVVLRRNDKSVPQRRSERHEHDSGTLDVGAHV